MRTRKIKTRITFSRANLKTYFSVHPETVNNTRYESEPTVASLLREVKSKVDALISNTKGMNKAAEWATVDLYHLCQCFASTAEYEGEEAGNAII